MAIRVLLADDLYFMRMVQKEVLEANGYEIVAEAATGVEAVEKYKAGAFSAAGGPNVDAKFGV